ncbi:MAG: asparagine synthase (glutamine-hydrolysing) [Candidatus Magnetoglobus multicellularis str. Araruama]|uniref:Asparagine synthase (Glutamine-hydrolysing) n=1 Tax=Candidatus Magnetoglobus multicellularis str. Araruama TaxID=890399 RepID=A0A1V1PB36_9BACT|nr:MAG: asparagine synthase (glutamine-hydrolysing) [Candidatus Magnetoglobus multicellularis str. Araruama]
MKRLPDQTEPVGVFLSGGIDSSIIASIVASYRKDAIYYTLKTPHSSDSSYVKQLERYLGLKRVKYIEYIKDDSFTDLIKSVVYATESYNPSIISNGICSYLLAESANKDGLKVVLSGEGADEIFCGYHMFQEKDEWKHIRQSLISDMCFTELRRIDQTCMAHSIENRCPFLDKSIYTFSSSLTYNDFFHAHEDHMENKYILRNTAEHFLPQEIVRRKKTSFDVGSGIRALVVNHLTKDNKNEKEVLKEIWKQFYKGDSTIQYYHSYPVFDKSIEKRGAAHK